MSEVLAGQELTLRQTVLWWLLRQGIVSVCEPSSSDGYKAALLTRSYQPETIVSGRGHSPAAALQSLAEEVRGIIEDMEPIPGTIREVDAP